MYFKHYRYRCFSYTDGYAQSGFNWRQYCTGVLKVYIFAIIHPWISGSALSLLDKEMWGRGTRCCTQVLLSIMLK
jgi:hypothetical protein